MQVIEHGSIIAIKHVLYMLFPNNIIVFIDTNQAGLFDWLPQPATTATAAPQVWRQNSSPDFWRENVTQNAIDKLEQLWHAKTTVMNQMPANRVNAPDFRGDISSSYVLSPSRKDRCFRNDPRQAYVQIHS